MEGANFHDVYFQYIWMNSINVEPSNTIYNTVGQNKQIIGIIISYQEEQGAIYSFFMQASTILKISQFQEIELHTPTFTPFPYWHNPRQDLPLTNLTIQGGQYLLAWNRHRLEILNSITNFSPRYRFVSIIPTPYNLQKSTHHPDIKYKIMDHILYILTDSHVYMHDLKYHNTRLHYNMFGGKGKGIVGVVRSQYPSRYYIYRVGQEWVELWGVKMEKNFGIEEVGHQKVEMGAGEECYVDDEGAGVLTLGIYGNQIMKVIRMQIIDNLEGTQLNILKQETQQVSLQDLLTPPLQLRVLNNICILYSPSTCFLTFFPFRHLPLPFTLYHKHPIAAFHVLPSALLIADDQGTIWEYDIEGVLNGEVIEPMQLCSTTKSKIEGIGQLCGLICVWGEQSARVMHPPLMEGESGIKGVKGVKGSSSWSIGSSKYSDCFDGELEQQNKNNSISALLNPITNRISIQWYLKQTVPPICLALNNLLTPNPHYPTNSLLSRNLDNSLCQHILIGLARLQPTIIGHPLECPSNKLYWRMPTLSSIGDLLNVSSPGSLVREEGDESVENEYLELMRKKQRRERQEMVERLLSGEERGKLFQRGRAQWEQFRQVCGQLLSLIDELGLGVSEIMPVQQEADLQSEANEFFINEDLFQRKDSPAIQSESIPLHIPLSYHKLSPRAIKQLHQDLPLNLPSLPQLSHHSNFPLFLQHCHHFKQALSPMLNIPHQHSYRCAVILLCQQLYRAYLKIAQHNYDEEVEGNEERYTMGDMGETLSLLVDVFGRGIVRRGGSSLMEGLKECENKDMKQAIIVSMYLWVVKQSCRLEPYGQIMPPPDLNKLHESICRNSYLYPSNSSQLLLIIRSLQILKANSSYLSSIPFQQ